MSSSNNELQKELKSMTAWQNNTGRNRPHRPVWMLCLLLVTLLVTGASQMFAQSTAAGTTITNQASVTWSDNTGAGSYNANSNTVTTYVNQVDAYTITPNPVSINTIVNEQIKQQYTLTNTSNNAAIWVQLTAPQSGAFALTSAHLNPDNAGAPGAANVEGTTISIPAGGTYKFWLTGTVPSSVTIGQTATYTITVKDVTTANFTPTGYTVFPAADLTDPTTLTITKGADIVVTKSLAPSSGLGNGASVTMTLTYKNQGATGRTAQTIDLYDNVPAGATFEYVAGNATWMGSTPVTVDGATVNSGGQSLTITNTAGKLHFALTGVPADPAGTTTYTITIPLRVNEKIAGTYTNTAYYNFSDSVNFTPFSSNSATCSNLGAASPACQTAQATYTITNQYLASLTTALQTAPATYGATANYGNINVAKDFVYLFKAVNTGNFADTVQLQIQSNTFPAGTTFTWYTNVGDAPGVALTSTSGTNGSAAAVYNSGSLAAFTGEYPFVVVARVPATATPTGSVNFVVQAKPQNGTGTAVTVIDSTTRITYPVDVATNVPVSTFAGLTSAQGLGVATPTPTAYSTIVTSPGLNPAQSYTYSLYLVNNQVGGATNNFQIVATNVAPTTETSDALTNMSVAYYLPGGANCSTLGAPISWPVAVNPYYATDGTPQAGSEKLVCAVVTVAPQTPANSYAVYFQAQSNGLKDGVLNAITVNTYAHISISSQVGVVTPGGFVVHTNVITNDGNVAIPASGLSNFGVTDTYGQTTSGLFTTWAGGVADPTGPITGGTLLPSSGSIPVLGTLSYYTKVSATDTALAGQINTSNLTVSYSCSTGTCTATATDTTTINANFNNLLIEKWQAVDTSASCNAALGSLTFVKTNLSASPGNCIVYQIKATNNTGNAITNVQISDIVSSYTTLCSGGGVGSGCSYTNSGTWTTTPGGTTYVGGSNTSTVVGSTLSSPKIVTLPATQSATYTFAVKVK